MPSRAKPKPAAKSPETPRKKAAAKAPKAKAPARAKKAPAGKEGARWFEEHVAAIGGWRGETLARVRRLVREADPGIVEERKWVKPTNPAGVVAWSRAGIVATGEVYKEVVKVTFARGASLPDPRKLFNASLEGGTRRAIDLREGDALDAQAFQALVRAAVAHNVGLEEARSRKRARPSG